MPIPMQHMRELEAKQALWRKRGMNEHEMFDKAAIRQHIGSTVYEGA